MFWGGGYLNKTLIPEQRKTNENIELAVYLENEQTNSIPSKESGYYFDREKSNCTNEAYINWDSVSWSPVVSNMSEYKTRCELHFTKIYTEGILNGTDPVLKDELVPITIEENGTVKKANLENEWYSYEKKEWANAVILFDESKDYLAGEIIPENAIESYFVWIPKYRYQLWDLGNYDSLTVIDESKVHEIPIIFGDYNTGNEKDGECTTPMESGASGNCQVGDYMTHPAFISIPSTGFWVGKFETGYDGATSTTEAQQNVNDSSKVIIKPNVYSWRSIQVANAFYSSYDYQRNLDSHMMKNTEWGAVAYLQHSAYGSATSVRTNNNGLFVTGYASYEEPTCGYYNNLEECNLAEDVLPSQVGVMSYPYNTKVGFTASTTGNISGIYDMSGGAYEFVMGIMTDEEGTLLVGKDEKLNSGFNGKLICQVCDLNGDTEVTTGYDLPESRYYDIYNYTYLDTGYDVRILGDATGEMGPFSIVGYSNYDSIKTSSWYSDQGWSITYKYDSPWYVRGWNLLQVLNVGIGAGIFSFDNHPGEITTSSTFRIVLTPE